MRTHRHTQHQQQQQISRVTYVNRYDDRGDRSLFLLQNQVRRSFTFICADIPYDDEYRLFRSKREEETNLLSLSSYIRVDSVFVIKLYYHHHVSSKSNRRDTVDVIFRRSDIERSGIFEMFFEKFDSISSVHD